MKITLLLDNPDSWFMPYAKELKKQLQKKHSVKLVHKHSQIKRADLTFLLSCTKKLPAKIMALSDHNLVVHASKLPKGRGWSPLTWQILEGKNSIPVTLFEAAESIDSGEIYLQETVQFKGHELIDELRAGLGKKINAMVLKFVRSYPKITGKTQRGVPTYYDKRSPKDSELDTKKSLKQLFNQLRVADNERYPAFFRHKGKKYTLHIHKEQ